MEDKYEIKIIKKENLFDWSGDSSVGYRYSEDIDVCTVFVDGIEYEFNVIEYKYNSYEGGLGYFYEDYKLYKVVDGKKEEVKDKTLRIAVEEAAAKVNESSESYKRYNQERGRFYLTEYPGNSFQTYTIEKRNKQEVPRILKKEESSVTLGAKGATKGVVYTIEVNNELYAYKIAYPDKKGILNDTKYSITYLSRNHKNYGNIYHAKAYKKEQQKHKYFELFQTLVSDYEKEHSIEEQVQYIKK